MKRGKIIIFSGPSGVGKGTIRNKFFNLPRLNLVFSISATTRKPRVGEENGREYYFLTKKDFKKRIKNDEFLEYAVFANNYYGTLISEVDNKLNMGYNVFLEIEPQGALQIIKKRPQDVVTIFLKPPKIENLEERLKNRGTETSEQIKERISVAESEIKIGLQNYKYNIINDNIDDCVKEVVSSIEKEIN